MIKHIVMWRLKSQNNDSRLEHSRNIKVLLEGLKDKIPEINTIEVGIDISNTESSFHVVLYSKFDTIDKLNKYQKHPEHQKALPIIKALVSERKVVDYIV